MWIVKMDNIHLIFKEDSQLSSFLCLFGGIIEKGSDIYVFKRVDSRK